MTVINSDSMFRLVVGVLQKSVSTLSQISCGENKEVTEKHDKSLCNCSSAMAGLIGNDATKVIKKEKTPMALWCNKARSCEIKGVALCFCSSFSSDDFCKLPMSNYINCIYAIRYL